MEKLTPTRFSQVKDISGSKNGKSYAFHSVGFQTREYGDRWFNFAFNDQNPLKEGQTYELEVKERPYKDKDNNDKVAYDAKFPDKVGILQKQVGNIMLKISELELRVGELEKAKGPNIPVIQDDNFDQVNAELAGVEPDLPF